MLINWIAAICAILFISPSKSIQNTSKLQSRQRSSLSKVSLTECSYNGGTINNSTVIELGNCFNDFYYIGLNIGTGPQYFNFQFDTGSPTLWIPLGTNPTGFNQLASSTYSTTNKSASIEYDSGKGVSGYMGNDIVSINQTPLSSNTSILFATVATSSFPETTVFGLVGMDYGSYPNFLDIAYQNGQISTPVFSLDLNGVNQTSLMYYNNGLPNTVLQNTVWVPMMSETQFWKLQVIGLSVNGVDVTSLAANYVIVDSGTSLISLNQDLYNSIIQQYFNSSLCFNDFGIYCPCNGTWPDLAFIFPGAEVYLQGTAYQIQSGEGYCEVGFESASTNKIVLGDQFFRSFVVTFDRLNARVGFYGNVTAIVIPNTFDPNNFVVSQYIIGGFVIFLALVGIYIWVSNKSALQRKLKNRGTTQSNRELFNRKV